MSGQLRGRSLSKIFVYLGYSPEISRFVRQNNMPGQSEDLPAP